MNDTILDSSGIVPLPEEILETHFFVFVIYQDFSILTLCVQRYKFYLFMDSDNYRTLQFIQIIYRDPQNLICSS